MLRNLFGTLTGRPKRGQSLFDRVVEEARRPGWYREGGVPDSIDGRFAMLASICALAIVRLESGPASGELASAALTERFIEAMDAEHRELGLNDPGLGRRVRKLVGALGRRVDEWQLATAGDNGWDEAVGSSLYRGQAASGEAVDYSKAALAALWQRLAAASDKDVEEGRW